MLQPGHHKVSEQFIGETGTGTDQDKICEGYNAGPDATVNGDTK